MPDKEKSRSVLAKPSGTRKPLPPLPPTVRPVAEKAAQAFSRVVSRFIFGRDDMIEKMDMEVSTDERARPWYSYNTKKVTIPRWLLGRINQPDLYKGRTRPKTGAPRATLYNTQSGIDQITKMLAHEWAHSWADKQGLVALGINHLDTPEEIALAESALRLSGKALPNEWAIIKSILNYETQVETEPAVPLPGPKPTTLPPPILNTNR